MNNIAPTYMDCQTSSEHPSNCALGDADERAPDNVTKFISSVVPVIVAECAKRFPTLEEYGMSDRRGAHDLMHLVEKVSADVVDECEFDIEESEGEFNGSTELPHISNIVGESPLTPIQNLKLDLAELFYSLREEITAEIKESLKEELRMELFLDLEKMRAEMINSGARHAAQPKNKEFGAATLPTFSLDIGAPVKMVPIISGFESISDVVTFGAKSGVGINTCKNTYKNADKNTSGVASDVDAGCCDGKDPLADNPLFARVTKNLDRMKRGEAMYTVDDMIKERGNRFDAQSILDFRNRASSAKVDYESSDEEEDTIWAKLVEAKFTANQ